MGDSKKNNSTAGSIPVRSTKQTAELQRFVYLSSKSRTTARTTRGRYLFDEFLREYSQTMHISNNSNYKQARLYNGKGDINKDWRVEYWYLIPGTTETYKRFVESFDMNRIKNYADRLTYGEEAVKFMNKKLAEGFNPFTVIKKSSKKLPEDFHVTAQLQQVINELNLKASPTSRATYTEVKNRFLKWVVAKNYQSLTISDIDLDKVRNFKKWALYEADLNIKTVNNTLSHLGMFWDVAAEKKLTALNPFRLIPRAKKKDKARSIGKVERFEPLTDTEMNIVFNSLKEQQQLDFIRFLSAIFYAFARPVEITRLRVADIEFDRELIRFKKSDTKSDKSAYVQIVPPFKKLLLQMELNKYPGNYFLFSKDFTPGTVQVSKHYALRRWRELVKDGLEINKDMYALKHTGNIDYLQRNKGNINKEWQRSQNRHSSTAVTDRYNRGLGAYFIEVSGLNFKHFE